MNEVGIQYQPQSIKPHHLATERFRSRKIIHYKGRDIDVQPLLVEFGCGVSGCTLRAQVDVWMGVPICPTHGIQMIAVCVVHGEDEEWIPKEALTQWSDSMPDGMKESGEEVLKNRQRS